jgi:hypothetical protein
VRTEPRGWKARPITDVTSTALRKEEMDPLLGNDHETSNYATVIGNGSANKYVSTETREYSNNGTYISYTVRAEVL